MLDKINEIALLINNKKIKKATNLLNKINLIDKNKYYELLDMEGACLYAMKKYTLALQRFEQAKNLCNDKSTKSRIFTNIAACHQKNLNHIETLKSLEQSIQLDSSFRNLKTISNMSHISVETKNYALTYKYAVKLLGYTETANEGLYLLLKASLEDNDKENIQLYTKKLIAQCVYLTSEEAVNFLKLLHSNGQKNTSITILEKLHSKHQHEDWFNLFNSEWIKHEGQFITNAVPSNKNMTVSGDCTETIKLIEHLLKENKNHGAKLHDNVSINVNKGNLSVFTTDKVTKYQTLIEIPFKLMPILSDYTLKVKDYQLQVENKETMLNPSAATAMNYMVQIYNKTNKLANWEKTCPFFTLQNNLPVLRKLIGLKKHHEKITNFYSLLEKGEHDELLLKTFLGSRNFHFTKDVLINNNIATKKEHENGLLNIIDFLNHDINANSFHLTEDSCSITKKDDLIGELYVKYNHFDLLTSFLIYGYVQTTIQWINSVPLDLITTNGIKIKSVGVPTDKEKDATTEHLKNYVPKMINLGNNLYGIDNLAIPCREENQLLRETLIILLKTIDLNGYLKTDTMFNNEAIHLEKQIISANISFWEDILKLNDERNNDVTLLCNTISKHLRSYQASHGITTF